MIMRFPTNLEISIFYREWTLVVGQLGVEEFWFVCHDSLKISGCHYFF
jgi:hypothetical protein